MSKYEITTRQSEIIEAAGRILSAYGVTGLTIKKLAQEMNFSESAIYRHFNSKEDIIITLLNYLANNIETRLTEVVKTKDTCEEKFISVFESQFKFFSKNSHLVVAAFSDGLFEESEKINACIQNIISTKTKILIPILKECQMQGAFTKKVSTDELAHICMGGFRLLMYKWRISNFKFNLSKQGSIYLESLLILIKK